MKPNLMTNIFIGYVTEIIKKNNKPTLELRVRVPSLHTNIDDKDLPIAKPLVTAGITIDEKSFYKHLDSINRVYLIFDNGNKAKPLWLGVINDSTLNDLNIKDINSTESYDTFTNFPTTGEDGIFYIDKKTGFVYVYNTVTSEYINITQADISGDLEALSQYIAANYSKIGHKHTISDVTNLQTELGDKSNIGHGHEISDINNLQSALDSKADEGHNHDASYSKIGHTHLWNDITDKPATFLSTPHTHDDRYYTETEVDTKLAGKSNTVHTHTKSDITDFAHTHAIAEVTGLQGKLDEKVDKTITVAGIPLNANVTPTQIANALREATHTLKGLMSATDKANLNTLMTILGDEEGDTDTFVNTIREVIAVFENYPEGANLADALSTLTTNLDTHVDRTDNPHSVTKAQVGLGNVDNIQQATKAEFNTHVTNVSNPHNVTKAQVGLSNVDNIKQATKTEFDAHTGNTDNPHTVTKAQVGLSNVTNDKQFTREEFDKLNLVGVKNLGTPDLTGKHEISDGVYRLYDASGVTVDYDYWTGEFIFNGTASLPITTNFSSQLPLGVYVIKSYSSTPSSGKFRILGSLSGGGQNRPMVGETSYTDGITTIKGIDFWIYSDYAMNNMRVKVQIEKGVEATDYQVPIQPIIYHETKYLEDELDTKANTVHTHTFGDITGTAVATQIPTLPQSKITNLTTDLGNKADKSNTYTKVEVDNIATTLQDDINTKAPQNTTYTKTEVDGFLSGKSNTGHTHNASDINAGILSSSRLPNIPIDKIPNIPTTKLTPTSSRTIDPTSYGRYDYFQGDTTAFLPIDQIIVEQSIDGGVTWTDTDYSEYQKCSIFSGKANISIGIPLKNGVRNTDCMLRVTITGMKYNVPENTPETERYNYWNKDHVVSTERYANVSGHMFFVSAVSDRIYVDVQTATGENPNNWVSRGTMFLSGWSGSNVMYPNSNSFGGGITQTNNPWNRRFVFRTATTSEDFNNDNLTTTSTTRQQSILLIKTSSGAVWTRANSYMANGHLYDWDRLQNVTFPASLATEESIYEHSNKRVYSEANKPTWNDVQNKPTVFPVDSHTHSIGDVTNLQTELNKKVDKVTGKQLSTNDYTTAEKNKLSGIEAGAEVNVQSDWNATSGDALILNKPHIPTKVSDLTNDTGYITGYTETDPIFTAWDKSTGISISKSQVSDFDHTHNDIYYTETEVDTLLAGKVDKVSGKGLSTNDYTTAEKTKLSGIATGAEVNVQPDWNQADANADDYIKNKPTYYNPDYHTHEIDDINELQSTIDRKIEPQNASTVLAGNCNNIVTTSIYQGGWNYNRPTGASSYGTLITTQTSHGSDSYLRQIYLSEGSTKMYTRVKASTWQAWEQIGTMSLSGTTLNITL